MTPNELTPDLAAFIEVQTSIFLATASANGQPHIQHRGPPRFLRVLDDKTPGNGDPGSQRLRSSIWCWRDHSAGYREGAGRRWPR